MTDILLITADNTHDEKYRLNCDYNLILILTTYIINSGFKTIHTYMHIIYKYIYNMRVCMYSFTPTICIYITLNINWLI